jgi:hypothetical protein
MIKRYDSIAAMRAHYISLGKPDGNHGTTDLTWFANESEETTLKYMENGNTSLVPEAEKLIDKLDLAIETPRRIWERSPAGAFCIVPDVLAGLPTPMRRQMYQKDETAPIVILATTTSSAAVSAEVIMKRGIGTLALTIILSRIRPVELHAVAVLDGNRDGTGDAILMAQINTSPLDIATACYVLTSAGYDRRITHGLAKSLADYRGDWAKGFGGYGKADADYNWFAEKLSYDPPPTMHDLVVTDPLKWVNAQIKRFTQNEEE